MGFSDKLTTEQELCILRGRVEATIEYIRTYQYSPDKEVILAMLGGTASTAHKEEATERLEGDNW